MKQGRNNKRIVKCGISLVILCTLLVPNAPMTAWAVSSADITNPTEVEGQINEIGDREVTGLDTDTEDVGDSNTETAIDTETQAETEVASDISEDGTSLTDVSSEKVGSVALNSTTFPDEIFRKYIADRYDKDKNGELSQAEISSADSIDANKKGIKSVKGVEYLSELLYLCITNNSIENIDLSNNKKLIRLECSLNKLTSIDISANTELRFVWLVGNNITSLNLLNNTKIEELYCNNNQLTELDVSNLSELGWLACGYNKLNELNVSKNLKLKQLNINSTNITKMDLSSNTKLNTFACAYTDMTSIDLRNNNLMGSLICAYSKVAIIQWGDMSNYWFLNLSDCLVGNIDVSQCPDLAVIYCENNNMTELDVTKNSKLLDLYCSNNNLTKLDVSNNPLLNTLECSNNHISKLELPNQKQLYDLYCEFNNLSALDLSNTDVVRGEYYGNRRELSADKDGYVDLSVLEADGFDITKTSNWSSNVEVNTVTKKLKVDFSSSTTRPKQVDVTYHYNINNSYLEDEEFILRITQYRTDIADAVIEMYDSQTYWGLEINGIKKITYNGEELIRGGAYSIEGGGTNINVGTATVTINGINDFAGSVTKTFEILPAPISKAVLEKIGDQTYTGTAITPNVSLKLKYADYMVKDKDYTLRYASNTAAGTATVTITGKGNYTGEVTTSFKINPSKIATGKIGDISKQAYSGSEVKPSITLTVNNRTLINGTDYDLSYSNNINLGTATVTATGKGNYTGSISKTFKISIATVNNLTNSKATTSSIKLKWDKASGVDGYEIYSCKTGSKKYTKLTTIKKASTTTYTNKKLKIGTAYSYKIRAYKTINGKKQYGEYTAVLNTATSMAKPKINLSAGSKKATITYQKVSGANGYEIYMSTSKKGTYEKVKTLTKVSKIKYTKTGLKKGKTYYFKVRAYKNINGAKVYSSYSAVKKIKVK
ncbi:fibronectin type III domain-containing protein [Konateibacter massiliensis]|uniref:fibronectin type III domain-containing protein n=1 Tax=Konateibacter massiliensis TaxID=2002841 RepID=UPI000C152531|nr:fibronectin type III domain-containing protein [Konateibacter massiliensis]